MKTASIASLLGLLVVATVPAAAQQAASSPVRTTTTAVNRVVHYKVLPGQGATFNQDVLDNLIPVYEELKKAGLITDYRFMSKTTTDGPDDWSVGLMISFPNFAALDNFGPRTDPITLKHYGSAEKRTAAGMARNGIRTVVASYLTQTLSFTR